KAYREEIADLYKAGCRYLQIDDTTIAMWGDPKVQDSFKKLGDDPKKDAEMYAAAVNEAIREVPDDMTVCIHTCRGNFKSTWLAAGGYADFVAERVFTGLDVDGFFLEYDDERSGGFEPLRFVPKGKKVVLGLVSSKLPELEAKDTLKRRIDAAAKRDEEAYMARLALTDAEKALIRQRDFQGLIDAGMNIYSMLKIGSATGNGLYKMGAQMRGESYEQFLATRKISGAT